MHEVETMAYAGETPWHGLGKLVHHDLTPEQMLAEAGLNWTIDKRPVQTVIRSASGKSTTKVIPGKKALVRMPRFMAGDKYMGEVQAEDDVIKTFDIVSDGWNVLQNHEAFEFFHEYVMEGNLEMHTAGSLRGGEVVWALAKIKEGFSLFGGDDVESYMLFSVKHRYGRAHNVSHVPVRVVCMNTLRMALSETIKDVRVTHQKKFDPAKVKQDLGIAHNQLAKYKEQAEFLGSKRYTEDAVAKYFLDIYPPSEKQLEKSTVPAGAQTMMDALESQPGHQFAPGTWWQAFNAVTFAIDHKIGKTADVRLDAAWFGGQAAKKSRALESAIEWAKAS